MVLGWKVQFVTAIGTTICFFVPSEIGDGEVQWEGWLVKSMKGEAIERIKQTLF
jgi:hypothetical protein